MSAKNLAQAHQSMQTIFKIILCSLTGLEILPRPFSFMQQAQAQLPCITRQELSARSLGIIQKIHVANGTKVKKGTLILELDARMIKAGLKEGNAAIDAAKGNEELAQDATMRLEKLKGSDSVTEQQIVEARIRLAQAKAVRRQAEAAVERVKVQLEDTQIKADLPGLVQGLPSIIGMPVQPGQSMGRIEADSSLCSSNKENKN